MKNGHVQAYSRLNPTTKPHILSEIYPHLATRGIPRDERVWEWSRMGTAKHARSNGHGWNSPIGLLLRCVSYAALKNRIKTLVWQAHPVWITRAGELGFNPEPLGLPQRIGGERVIAAKMDVEANVFHTMDALNVPRVELGNKVHSGFSYLIRPDGDMRVRASFEIGEIEISRQKIINEWNFSQ